jgi:CheY-like chemotaxis protein
MSGESIFIVEDEGLIALHLFELLEKAGYRIAGTAYSGEVALRDIGKSPLPDLILMDIALAGVIDGIETARRIRQQYDIPIIYLTAFSNPSRVEEAKEVSPYGYLMKPVMKDDLLDTIRSVFDSRSA